LTARADGNPDGRRGPSDEVLAQRRIAGRRGRRRDPPQGRLQPTVHGRFLQDHGRAGGRGASELFSSHPNPGNRQEAIKKQIANWPAANYVEESPSFNDVHKHAVQVKTYTPQEIQAGAKSGQWAALNKQNGAGLYSPGESTFPTRASAPPNAVSLESVQPSQNMTTANLGPMKISRPDNWPVTLPEQQGQFVTIAHQAGVTNRGVGYGVLLNGAPGPQGQRVSIDDMTVQLIKQIQQSNELEQLGDPQPLTVGGVEGRSTFLRSPSPFPDSNGQTQPERDWLVTVPMRDGSMIFMIFVAPQADFDRLQPTYQAMVKSVQFR
jgi:hypothetical protein